MMTHSIFLSHLKSHPTRYKESQGKTLEFLASTHEKAAQLSHEKTPVGKLLMRYGVKDNYISTRGFECPDIYAPEEDRKLYKITSERPFGANIQERTEFYKSRASEVFEAFYDRTTEIPDHLIHVTCTGYISPSAAQLMVAEKGWNTEITHAYHMGCYAALPAVRMAWGQALRGKSVDIVHNEMCSLHMNPSVHTPEQLVVQTLFADGHIKYRVSTEPQNAKFKVLTVKEKLIPNTSQDMSWMPAPFGMAMNLSREVPKRIEDHVRTFTMQMLEEAQVPLDHAIKNALFAIHPGGPKIVETVAQALELSETQIQASKKILFHHGNMSSATLPHIWEEIEKSNPRSGTYVISLAFGPGLTVFGSVFECC